MVRSLLLWLLACDPTQSGPGALVGTLVDADGTPLMDVEVTSLETRSLTDSSGAFAVEFKPPDQHASFQVGGARYLRTHQAEDAGRVTVKLPVVTDRDLVCGAACTGELRWSFGGGLSARRPVACTDNATAPLLGVPEPLPQELRCDEGERTLELRGEVWMLQAPLAPVRVEVRAEPAPQACTVRTGDVLAQPTGDGTYVGSGRGRVTVSAVCDGRPALPQVVAVDGETAVTLDWSAQGASIDGGAIGPELARLELVASPEEGDGWHLAVQADESGVFELPTLPPGRYRFTAGPDDGVLPIAIQVPEARVAGVMALREEGQVVVGAFFVDRDHSGPVAAW